MGKKNIVILTSSFPFGKGEQFLEIELEFLSKEFETIYIIPANKFNNNNKLLASNIIICDPIFERNRLIVLFSEIFNNAPILFIFRGLFKKNRLKYFIAYISECLRIRKILKNKDLLRLVKTESIIETLFYSYWGFKSANIIPFIRAKGFNTIVRFHGSDLYSEINNESNEKKILFQSDIINNSTYSIFISNYGKEHIEKKYKINKASLIVSRLGVVGLGKGLYSSDNVLRIVSCSSIIPLKRVSLIAKALSKIEFPVVWTHFGVGPERDLLIKITQNFPAHIIFNELGYQENKFIRNYYITNPVDLFINVSTSEGVPVSIMEALSAGIPVLATKVGGTAELVDNSLGYIIDKEISADILKDYIVRFNNLSIDDKNIKRENAFNCWFEKANAEVNFSNFSNLIRNI